MTNELNWSNITNPTSSAQTRNDAAHITSETSPVIPKIKTDNYRASSVSTNIKKSPNGSLRNRKLNKTGRAICTIPTNITNQVHTNADEPASTAHNNPVANNNTSSTTVRPCYDSLTGPLPHYTISLHDELVQWLANHNIDNRIILHVDTIPTKISRRINGIAKKGSLTWVVRENDKDNQLSNENCKFLNQRPYGHSRPDGLAGFSLLCFPLPLYVYFIEFMGWFSVWGEILWE